MRDISEFETDLEYALYLEKEIGRLKDELIKWQKSYYEDVMSYYRTFEEWIQELEEGKA